MTLWPALDFIPLPFFFIYNSFFWQHRTESLYSLDTVLDEYLIKKTIAVLYVSFDRFPLPVESGDLSQADKSIKRVSSLPKLYVRGSRTSFSVSQQLRPELSAK